MNRFTFLSAARPRLLVLGISLALGLAGCGGGGSSIVRPTQPPSNSGGGNNGGDTGGNNGGGGSSSDQPAIDAHLTLTNAYAAHDAGFTGQGVIIGVVDTGINHNHPALKGRVLKELIYLDPSQNDLTKDDVVGHGTWVSQVAAGKPFGQWPGGIAPDADLVSARIISDSPPADDGSGQGNQVEASDADFFGSYLLPDLIDANVQIMNNSWGGLYFDPANIDTVAAAFADAFRPFVIDHDGLVVFATGNEGAANPTDTTSLPYWAPDLERGWIAAAALDTLHPTQLASYSNACGRAMDYCITAPGDVVVTGADDTSTSIDYWVVSGTSFATPEVSGAAADVWQAFPYFNNDMVRQTLLGTAKDLGDPGVDPVFGWGLLDVGKAVKGPANFAWGDVSVSFDTITSTWSNDIVGDGGLNKDGTGTLVLSGQDSYAGDTNVLGGTLQSANALPGNVSVSAGAALSGMGDGPGNHFGVPGVAGNLDNAGAVVVANGDTQVGGDYHQASTGTLAINLGSKLDVTGSATLDGGTLEVLGADSGYVTTTHQDLLTAGGGVTGTFDSLTKDSGVFLSSTLQYDAGAVWLDTTSLSITTAAANAGVNMTPATVNGANRVQGAFDQIDSKISTGALGSVSAQFVSGAGYIQHSSTTAAAQATLDSLSGQLHAASAAMTFESIDASTQALTARFDNLLEQRDSYGMWLRNVSVGGDMARSGFNGVGFQLNGWLAGTDRRIGVSGFGGFAFGQNSGQQRLDQAFDHNRSRSTQAMMYAGWVQGRWYTQGVVGFGSFHQDVTRRLLLGDTAQGVWTAYNGRYSSAYGETGLHFSRGDSQLTPFVDVQYARINRDGFTEQGGYGFGLTSGAQVVDRWQAGVGLRAGRQWQWGQDKTLDLTAHAEWQHTLSSHGDVFDASFVGLQQWQPLNGVGLSRDIGVLGINLDAALSKNASLKLGYDYEVGQRDHARTLSASYMLAF